MLHAAMGCWQRWMARSRAKRAAAALARRRTLLRCMRGWRAWAADMVPAPAAWAEEEGLLLSMPMRPCAALGSLSTVDVTSAGAWEASRSEDAEVQAMRRRMQVRQNPTRHTKTQAHRSVTTTNLIILILPANR